MRATLVVLLLIGVLMTVILAGPLWQEWRRDRLRKRPFPPQWQSIVEQSLPCYFHLTPSEREQLQGHIQVFLAEKQFIGCQGLQVTEAMKLTIAAMSCLLLLNRKGNYFSQLRSILVYPQPYLVTETTMNPGNVVEERRVARLGESWSRDQVVLAWAQVEWDGAHWQDGQNVVLHELAHQLDQEDGRAEGVPVLSHPALYPRWAAVMKAAYEQLTLEVAQGKPAVLNPYGATNAAEFFAVATETFFEKPRQLQKRHPALYEQLHDYYRLDPARWD